MDNAVIEKLERGLRRLASAGDDPDALGAALISLHGALEDHFRTTLATSPQLRPEQREAVQDRGRFHWKDLLDLLQLQGELTAETRRAISRANSQRQEVAHGGHYTGSRRDLERYAALVKLLVGYNDPESGATRLLPETLASPEPKAPRRAPARAAADEAAPRARSAVRPARAARPTADAPAARSGAPARRNAAGAAPTADWPRSSSLAALAVLLVLAALACSTLWAALGGGQPTQLAPTAAPAQDGQLPTPGLPRTAFVGGLEGAPLNVRVEPSLLATPLEIRLVEGDQVRVVDGPVEVDKINWWKIELDDGRQGWCAGQYLVFE